MRRRIGDPAGIALALNALGGVHHFRGDFDLARSMFIESLDLKQGLGNANSIAVSLTNLGLLERDAGLPEVAAAAFDEAIAIWERWATASGCRSRPPRACSPSTAAASTRPWCS